ncbi:ankyrin repeat-containing domain, PGG domain, Gag-polypeptide of LTR copia-type [Artemisia annua]|uniref:Ankyrin repeat-containing domain, PGG domain, Gag-polypeptide of LTR copia-type n=1 Tax=Artemisia annua TaxID=35608 RepID=A0A2U1LXV7_ARTAN|nr:ankyrin repeat-containing domain, PGG domain, Gag-polypeptide of LTR copia-type [Artemisia annua]
MTHPAMTNNIKNDIKEGMKSTSNNNNINEDDVAVFVAYNGKWEYEDKEWFFKNSRSSMIVVSKHITLSEITDNLIKQFKVDKEFYRLKLEVHYRTGSPWFPVIEIQNNQDLSVFISETSKTKLPLCVTRLDNKFENAVQYKDSSDVDEERRKDARVENILIKAIRKGDWVKAREIVNTEKVTWTLHFAVSRYKDNEIVKDIMMGINIELPINNNGENPVQTAAAFGNTEALKIMLASYPKYLFTPDKNNLLAIHYSLNNKTILYLFNQMKNHKVEYDKFLRDMQGFELLSQVIERGLIDVAYELINDYPSMAIPVYKDGKTALGCIVRKPELFYSGTHYNLCQRSVYHHVPIENDSLSSTDMADVENQEAPKKEKFVTKYTRRCLHDVISRICVKLWETTLLHVPHIKHLKDDKVKHNTTIKLLRRICEEVDRTHTLSVIKRLYSSLFCLAVENNTAEAVDVLSTYFAGLYDSYQDGQDIIQWTVSNHSKNVYIYMSHQEHFSKFDWLGSIDDDGNNILHLAGRLAPLHKLNAASGAALQMQQELQWFEEVKKVVGITHTQALNKNKETPMMVFRREHKKLRKDGEEWMKKTADSYTITAALIITIVFAAAITVPGGNNSATGKPIYCCLCVVFGLMGILIAIRSHEYERFQID